MKLLCEQVLEPLRKHFNCPIIIGSGYRSPTLNKAVGGVKNSQHMTGEAADIPLPDNATGRKWFLWMMVNLMFDQLIMEKALQPQPATGFTSASAAPDAASKSSKT